MGSAVSKTSSFEKESSGDQSDATGAKGKESERGWKKKKTSRQEKKGGKKNNEKSRGKSVLFSSSALLECNVQLQLQRRKGEIQSCNANQKVFTQIPGDVDPAVARVARRG